MKFLLTIQIVLLLLITIQSCKSTISDEKNEEIVSLEKNEPTFCILPYGDKDSTFALYYMPDTNQIKWLLNVNGEEGMETVVNDNIFYWDEITQYYQSKGVWVESTSADYFLFCNKHEVDTIFRSELEDSLFGYLLYKPFKKPISITKENYNKIRL